MLPERLPGGETPCFVIQALVLEVASPDRKPAQANDLAAFRGLQAAAAGPLGDDAPEGKCLGEQGVALVLKRLQNQVLERGLVTSRVLAPPQDLHSGTLKLTVLPGKIGTVRFQEDAQATPWLGNSFPAGSGDLLKLRDIEQGLENLRRPTSVEADIQIEPSKAPQAWNQSDLRIAYRRSAPVQLTLTTDDSGSQATSRYQSSATLTLDSPLRLSDLFSVTVNMASAEIVPRATLGHSVHYSLPVHYWSLSATHSQNYQNQNVAGQTQHYLYGSRGEDSELKVSALLYRNARAKFQLNLKAWQRRSANTVDDVEVLVQRRAEGGWELGIQHQHSLAHVTLNAQLQHRRGTEAFGAIAAPEEEFHEGSSRFGLWTLKIDAVLPPGRWRQSYRASLHLQHGDTPLTPNNRMGIGTRQTVRGFDALSTFSGERGWTLRNDWNLPLGSTGLQTYLGLDLGEVLSVGRTPTQRVFLSGGVLGLRGQYRNLSLDAFVGIPLSRPAHCHTSPTVAGFSLTLHFGA